MKKQLEEKSISKKSKSSKETEVLLRQLSASVGDFIRYWGFRRIHGQIWTQLYLSARPVSGADLSRRLKVSKALISSALGELLAYELILAQDLDGKTKLYRAHPDVFKVIKKILQEREAQLIKNAQDHFNALEKIVAKEPLDQSDVSTKRMQKLGEMISAAALGVDILIMDQENSLNLSALFGDFEE